MAQILYLVEMVGTAHLSYYSDVYLNIVRIAKKSNYIPKPYF